MCAYHGGTYDLKRDLVGVPGFKEVYHEELGPGPFYAGRNAVAVQAN